jgi:hypothetical protein
VPWPRVTNDPRIGGPRDGYRFLGQKSGHFVVVVGASREPYENFVCQLANYQSFGEPPQAPSAMPLSTTNLIF